MKVDCCWMLDSLRCSYVLIDDQIIDIHTLKLSFEV